MTDNNAQPASEEAPEEDLPIPLDIEQWFVEKSASYESLHPQRGMGRSIFEDGAYQMYQKLQPIINQKNAEIRHKDHDFAKLNQIVIDRDKEIADYRKALEELHKYSLIPVDGDFIDAVLAKYPSTT